MNENFFDYKNQQNTVAGRQKKNWYIFFCAVFQKKIDKILITSPSSWWWWSWKGYRAKNSNLENSFEQNINWFFSFFLPPFLPFQNWVFHTEFVFFVFCLSVVSFFLNIIIIIIIVNSIIPTPELGLVIIYTFEWMFQA